MNCPSCGADLEPKPGPGPGRPSVYCSETCRRLAEFQIRGIARRLDKAELEQREIKAGSWIGDDDERRARLNALRRWIKQDTAKLRALLGAKSEKESKDNQIAPEKSLEGSDLVPLGPGDLVPFDRAKSK